MIRVSPPLRTRSFKPLAVPAPSTVALTRAPRLLRYVTTTFPPPRLPFCVELAVRISRLGICFLRSIDLEALVYPVEVEAMHLLFVSSDVLELRRQGLLLFFRQRRPVEAS